MYRNSRSVKQKLSRAQSAEYFPGKLYINRGIDGQSTPEMLVRFRQDVIDLHAKVVVMLAGTNDIAGVTGPTLNGDIEDNYASMADLARAHQIQVVFASVLPVHSYTHGAEESFALRPPDRILAELAKTDHFTNYHPKAGLLVKLIP